MNRYFVRSLPAIIFVVLMTACSKNNGTARLKITLSDSPGDYDKVNIDIQSVQVNRSGDNTDQGWINLPNSSVGVVNLLDYTGGRELSLTDSDFPTGKISQIRLVLGPENSISINGNSLDMEAPSAMQSGLKLQVHTTLNEGIVYKFRLDFDASKSVVKTGNYQYILKPVITVISDEQSGAIKGEVNPAGENVAVLVTDGSGIIVASSFAPSGSADYLVPGIEPGAYNLVFDPGDNSDYEADTLRDVLVTLGTVNKEETVNLKLK